MPPAPPPAAEPELPSSPAVRAAEDVVHQITSLGESYDTIAAWYTGEASNAAPLARINGKRPGKAPLPGETVRIPGYLVKRDAPLGEAEVRLMASGETAEARSGE